MTIIKHAKVIGKESGISIRREVGIKLADDNKVIIIQKGGKITERSNTIVVLRAGINIASVGKVVVEVRVKVEGREVKNLHAGEKSG